MQKQKCSRMTGEKKKRSRRNRDFWQSCLNYCSVMMNQMRKKFPECRLNLQVLVLAGTHLLGYSNSFADADQAFAEGRYSDAFQAVAGEKVKEKDTDTYEKYRITAMVSAEYEAYESMMDAGVYDMALDSLIRTVQRYDKYLQDAETYGCRGEFDKIESAAETALQQDFGLTAEDARTMYALSNKETYSREIYKVLEKAGLSEVTE